MPDHDCPHCAEARAIVEQLRVLLPEVHSALARLQRREHEHEPHDHQPVTDMHQRHG